MSPKFLPALGQWPEEASVVTAVEKGTRGGVGGGRASLRPSGWWVSEGSHL